MLGSSGGLLVSGLLLAVMDCYGAEQQTTYGQKIKCSFIGGLPTGNIWRKHARSLALEVNNTRMKMPEYTKYSTGSDMWDSVCPVNKKPKKKAERPAVALVVFWKYLSILQEHEKILKEHEKRLKKSFLFYTCNEPEEWLNPTKLTEIICYILSGKKSRPDNTNITLTNDQVQKLSVSETLKVFQRFTECILENENNRKVQNKKDKKKKIKDCTKPVFAGCGRRGRRGRGKGKGKGKKQKKNKRRGRKNAKDRTA